MSTNLNEIYSGYSDEQLLDILAAREKYPSEVVETVEKLLAARDTTLATRGNEFPGVNSVQVNMQEGGVASVFDDPIDPVETVRDNARRRTYWWIIVIVTGIINALFGFRMAMAVIVRGTRIFRLRHMQLLAGNVYAICAITGLVLFICKKRAGWVLLAAASFYMTAYWIAAIGFALYSGSSSGVWIGLLLTIVFGAMSYLLQHSQIRRIYDVDQLLFRKTAFIAFVCFFALLVWTILRTIDAERRFG